MSDAVLSLQASHQGELVWLDLFTGGWRSLPTSAFDANLLLTDEFIPYFFLSWNFMYLPTLSFFVIFLFKRPWEFLGLLHRSGDFKLSLLGFSTCHSWLWSVGSSWLQVPVNVCLPARVTVAGIGFCGGKHSFTSLSFRVLPFLSTLFPISTAV